MIIGHFPTVQELSLGLCQPQIDEVAWQNLQANYPTSSLAIIELNVERWGKIALDGNATLRHFITPKWWGDFGRYYDAYFRIKTWTPLLTYFLLIPFKAILFLDINKRFSTNF